MSAAAPLTHAAYAYQYKLERNADMGIDGKYLGVQTIFFFC